MNRVALAAQLRSILVVLREELKPALASPQLQLRADLIDMLLSRIAVETEMDDAAPFDPKLLLKLRDHKIAADGTANEIADIALSEQVRRGMLEDRVAEMGRRINTARRSAKELGVSSDHFTAYLQRRFPEEPKATVERVTPIPGGRSKATILVELQTAKGSRSIVLRKDFDIGVAGTSVRYEYPVVRAAWNAGLLVPEPLWLEEDEAIIGGKFIAFAHVAGKSMGTLFHGDASPALLRQVAATLARLHAVDISRAGLDDTLEWAGDADPVQAMIDSFYGRYRDTMRPEPLMEAAFAWLRLHISDIGHQRALVHGDAALHNMLGQGDELTALLDWEFAHAGDPAEDLAYCRYLAERMLPWDDFMAAYREAGGRYIAPARLKFFSVWRSLRLAIFTGIGRALFESGRDQDLRIAAIGFNTFPKQLRDLAYDLRAATVVDSISPRSSKEFG